MIFNGRGKKQIFCKQCFKRCRVVTYKQQKNLIYLWFIYFIPPFCFLYGLPIYEVKPPLNRAPSPVPSFMSRWKMPEHSPDQRNFLRSGQEHQTTFFPLLSCWFWNNSPLLEVLENSVRNTSGTNAYEKKEIKHRFLFHFISHSLSPSNFRTKKENIRNRTFWFHHAVSFFT